MQRERAKRMKIAINSKWLRMTPIKVGCVILILGFAFLFSSVFSESYVAAFIGLGLTFWGALLMFVRSTKYVKLDLLTAASSSTLGTIEEMLATTAFSNKGIYLPPKLLPDYSSNLVSIHATNKQALPKREEITKNENSKTSKWLFLTPPGQALCAIFEKHLGKSFAEMDLPEFQRSLPKLFDELEITKHASLDIEGNVITVKAQNNIFEDLCKETGKRQRTLTALGSPFSSALGCALAKVAGKPVIIEKEEQTDDNTTTIQYRLWEE